MTVHSLRSAPLAIVDESGPIASSPEAEAFYRDVLQELTDAALPFLVAGGYAVSAYTGVRRPAKDLDIFTTGGDFPRVLAHLQHRGYAVTIKDERWLGKVHKGEDFVDVISGSLNGMVPVKEDWFTNAHQAEVLGKSVAMIGPTELVWSKAFIQNRHRHDGTDIVNVILKQHEHIDWRRLLSHMDGHWEILLAHLLNFRWAYPSERNHIPRWLMGELLDRLTQQLDLPAPETRVCRGRLLSRIDFQHAVEDWGFIDVGGDDECR
jgi:hypothetical protein